MLATILFALVAQVDLHTAHAALLPRLEALEERLGAMADATPAQRSETTAAALKLFDDIRRHAEEEETGLYAKADARVPRFTETMRYEHRIVGRSIDALRADKAPKRFARKALVLLGLIRAHFELEEKVVLPLVETAG